MEDQLKMSQKSKKKKVWLNLKEPIKFECLKEDITKCLENKDGKLVLCNACPCILNRYDVGIHTEIMYNYLKNQDLEKAYFYFKRLLSKFAGNIKCDIQSPLDFSGKDHEMPPGCLLFKKDFELFELLDEIQGELSNADSKQVSEALRDTITRFKRGIMANLVRLTRIAMDDKYKMKLKHLSIKAKIYNNSVLTGRMELEGMDLNMDKVADISESSIDDIVYNEEEEKKKKKKGKGL